MLMFWLFVVVEYDIGEDISRMVAYAYFDVASIVFAFEMKIIF